jgi:hypothetical protein
VQPAAASPTNASPHIPTGTHWPTNPDNPVPGAKEVFPKLKAAGYDFAVVTVRPSDKATLNSLLDVAHQNGLKLFVGAQPYPFQRVGNDLKLTPEGAQFMKNLSERDADVMGVWVSNEPFYTDPLHPTVTSDKGVYSAKQLSYLRDRIHDVYPNAKIMQDIGAPSAWAPGGHLHTGGKYPLDELKGVADYWGIFGDGAEPFKAGGVYNKEAALAQIAKEVQFVEGNLGGKAIVLAQSYTSPGDGITGYPSDQQINDFNCALRQRLPGLAGISWYVWQQSIYPNFLSKHLEQLPLTGPNACPSR